MKYVLYGLPCSGKTTLLDGLSVPAVHGSKRLNEMSAGRFSELSDEEKNDLRIKYAQQLSKRQESFISDGHYSFFDEIVFTEADGELYDVFIYCFCDPEEISKRLKASAKNQRFANLSIENIRKWQNKEVECLRRECHKRSKDFYVVKNINSGKLQGFIDTIEEGYSSFKLAKQIVDIITEAYPFPCELHICDGDKTIIKQDSFRICTDNYITHVFDGSFYTGYQSLLFSDEISSLNIDVSKLSMLDLNMTVYNMVADKNLVVLSSGIKELWEKIAARFGLENVIANTLINADTKYYVIKLLHEKEYRIIAYGDGKNDFYMLKEADSGYLYIGSYLNRSLRKTNVSGLILLYDKTPYIMGNEMADNVFDDIEICRSDSGINGSTLADAHYRLGKRLGEIMHEIIPCTGTAIIELERGGRFFGDGVYAGFGGKYFSYDSKKDEFPVINSSIAVIVDSVINTGNSILETIEKLKKNNSPIEIIITTNVIQQEALKKLSDYKIFAVRSSANSFIGSRQKIQSNGKGPDTAERLYNYL